MRCTAFLAAYVSALFGQGMPPITATVGYIPPQTAFVAPGQMVTLFVSGIPNRSAEIGRFGDVIRAERFPLPTELAGISVQLNQFPMPVVPTPILSVYQFTSCENLGSPPCGAITAITVQVPYELDVPPPGSLRAPIQQSFSIFDNGVNRGQIGVFSAFDRVHIADRCDSVNRVSGGGPYCQPLITHTDGTLVSTTAPARSGETLVAYAYGLGAAEGAKTGQAVAAPTRVRAEVEFQMRQVLASGPSSNAFPPSVAATVDFAGLTPGYVGLYQINFRVPTISPDVPPCSGSVITNALIRLKGGWSASSDAADICVDANPTPRP